MTYRHLPLPERPAPDAMGASNASGRVRLLSLLEGAQARQPGALDEVVAELSPLLWHVARAQGLDRATSEDVVQTAWLSLLRSLDEIRTPEGLVGWLVTVTKREAWRVRDLSRRQQPVDEQLFAGLSDSGSAPDQLVLDSEQRRLLWAAVNQLSERCRQLLRIVAFVHRPDYEAVAAGLGVPRGTVGPTRGRCLQKLRELLVSDPNWSTP
jgi:RNA polymerase sigma factor (sigma-70 family)